MKIYFKKNQLLRRIFYFYPFQLLLMTLKENLVYVFLWALFFGFITRTVAPKYGVPYLFLYPEYLNHVGIRAYLILGFSCGGFMVAYNISSYIVNSFRFPFLATLDRPFFTYSVNNFIIPLAFLITYCSCSINFRAYDGSSLSVIALHLFCFLFGVAAFIFITIVYFFFFDKGVFKVFGLDPAIASRINLKPVKGNAGYTNEWDGLADNGSEHSDRTWFVETFIGVNGRIRLARGAEHYDPRMLEGIFKQNHQTGAVFEIASIVTLFLLGIFRDNKLCMLPAGASVFLLFTIFIMFLSALHTIFRGWTATVAIVILLAINFASGYNWSFFSGRAFGLNYHTKQPADYSYTTLDKMSHDTAQFRKDEEHMMGIMNNWRKHSGVSKPVMVFINTSGGGLRSAMWTFATLQYTDSLLHGGLFNHTELITGSSGGMVGAAYFRELYLEKKQDKVANIWDKKYLANMSTDILNPVAFAIATNDLAFRLQKYNDGKYSYTKDRGFAFEYKLDQNTDSVMDKRISDYRIPEEDGDIPMMLITPTIVNDGRKMLISPQGFSFMSKYTIDTNVDFMPLTQDVEFTRLFANQDANNLMFTSALRMNATFPYITPITALPSDPIIDVMDAGLLDNYGLEETTKFIFTFKKWLLENTSRIVVIQIRDQYKEQKIVNNAPKNIFQSFTFPVNQFYSNLFPVQNYKEDRMLEYLSSWYAGKLDVIYFQLNNEVNDNISLSWHLTEKEKRQVRNSMLLRDNQEALEQLKKVLK